MSIQHILFEGELHRLTTGQSPFRLASPMPVCSARAPRPPNWVRVPLGAIAVALLATACTAFLAGRLVG